MKQPRRQGWPGNGSHRRLRPAEPAPRCSAPSGSHRDSWGNQGRSNRGNRGLTLIITVAAILRRPDNRIARFKPQAEDDVGCEALTGAGCCALLSRPGWHVKLRLAKNERGRRAAGRSGERHCRRIATPFAARVYGDDRHVSSGSRNPFVRGRTNVNAASRWPART